MYIPTLAILLLCNECSPLFLGIAIAIQVSPVLSNRQMKYNEYQSSRLKPAVIESTLASRARRLLGTFNPSFHSYVEAIRADEGFERLVGIRFRHGVSGIVSTVDPSNLEFPAFI